MQAKCSRALFLAVAAASCVLGAPAGRADPIVNPSFETGDTTGWNLGRTRAIMEVVTEGGASDGAYCFRGRKDPKPTNPPPPGAEWRVLIDQVLLKPSWATKFSIDVRCGAECTFNGGIDAAVPGWPIVWESISILSGVSSPAPNGFTRYTIDITPLTGVFWVIGFDMRGPWEGDGMVHVDNFQFIPEPGVLALLAGGACLCALRRRRR